MSYEAEHLKKLLCASQQGDQKAYKCFLEAILPIVTNRVSRQVIKKDDIDDVIQESLISIHKALATYDSRREVLPWLITIVHRRIIDYIRKVTRISDKEQLTIDGDVTFFEDETNSIVKGDLSILNKLPKQVKRAIILTKIDGYTTKEAAQILGVGEGAVRTKISRGLSKLKLIASKREHR